MKVRGLEEKEKKLRTNDVQCPTIELESLFGEEETNENNLGERTVR